MATVPVVLHTAAFIDEADSAYTLGGRAAYRMLVNISDANQVVTDAAKGTALTLTGINAVSWDRVNGLDGATLSLASPPTGMTLQIGAVTPDNAITGKRRLSIDTTPPGADHPTRWVGWATLGTVFTGDPVTPSGIPPNFASPGTGLAVLMFNNTSLSGSPIFQTVTRPVWSGVDNSAVSGFGGALSVSCRGSLKLPSTGSYRFVLQSDEGCRLWLDGVPYIDDWNTNFGDRSSGIFNGTAGQIVNIRAEMFNSSNATTFQIVWSIDGAPVVPVPITVMYPIGWDTPVQEAPRPVQESFGVDYVRRYF
jgi:PA14 domain